MARIPAVREGRARAPHLPDDRRILWIYTTRAVNEFLHTSYTPDQVAALPSDWLLAIVIAASELSKSHGG